MSTIGQRIRDRRIELNMSQDELAKKLGYSSRSTINKIELDKRDLRRGKVKEIADTLLTTPSHIMGWDEESPEVPQYDKKYYTLILAYEKLSEENKKMVLELIEKLGER